VLALLLAAGSALLWGTADFAGGKATQRASALLVAVTSQLAGLPAVAICIAAIGGRIPAPAEFAWAAAAGACGLLGLAVFYRALAGGAMAVVAPITGVVCAVVPLAVGLASERFPGWLRLFGALLAVASIGLVSVGPGRRGAVGPRLIGYATLAGLLFGAFFALLAQAGDDTGMWPLLGTRIGSLTLGAALLIATRPAGRPRGRVAAWVVGAGLFDVVANALYLGATQHGLLSIVAPVASLYPAATVLLALAIERERVRPVQLAGLGLAATALVLVAT
jgi:drug/metabolite transporter (DMT)-like permease